MAFLAGQRGRDVEVLAQALEQGSTKMVPAVLTELVSIPNIEPADEFAFLTIPLLAVLPGYWHRAGKARSHLFRLGYQPKLADTLIAQMCMDYRALFLTRDRDFTAFRKHLGLKLLP
jgi:hypothetical protein